MSATGNALLLGRLVRPADFERVLQMRSCVNSVHFAVHHLASVPSSARRRPPKTLNQDLSTARAMARVIPVDDSAFTAPSTAMSASAAGAASGHWLGVVVPKRHARRAVTRSLLKREMRAAAAHQVATLPAGLWVVRLRAPFDRAAFPSAASKLLQRSARDELEAVFSRAGASSQRVSRP